MSFKKVRNAHKTENTEDYLELIEGLIELKGEARIVDIAEKRPGQFDFKIEVSVEIEGGDKPALVAEWLSVQMAN